MISLVLLSYFSYFPVHFFFPYLISFKKFFYFLPSYCVLFCRLYDLFITFFYIHSLRNSLKLVLQFIHKRSSFFSSNSQELNYASDVTKISFAYDGHLWKLINTIVVRKMLNFDILFLFPFLAKNEIYFILTSYILL